MSGGAALWRQRLSRRALARLALGLAVGTLGGFIADWAHVPLAWMLGALFLCMFASLAGLPVEVPMWLRSWFMGLIGLFLGESFDGLGLDELARWPVTLLGAVLYVPVAAAAAYVFYRHVAGESRMTAICAAIPGGLTAVVLISERLGADERAVALAQSLRIAFVVVLAPFVAFGLLGLPPPSEATFAGRIPITPDDLALLVVVAGVVAWGIGRLGLPLPQLIGPILASAVLRMAGLVEGVLPHQLVEVALVVTGASIGSRFAGVALRRWLHVAVLTLGGTLVLLAVTLVFAVAASALTGIDILAALLAYAPGGVAEMSLIALAIDADPGFVAVHHVARIAFILVAVPMVGSWIRHRAGVRQIGTDSEH